MLQKHFFKSSRINKALKASWPDGSSAVFQEKHRKGVSAVWAGAQNKGLVQPESSAAPLAACRHCCFFCFFFFFFLMTHTQPHTHNHTHIEMQEGVKRRLGFVSSAGGWSHLSQKRVNPTKRIGCRFQHFPTYRTPLAPSPLI